MLDTQLNLYISDINVAVVRKIASNGIVSTVAGTGVASPAATATNGDGGFAADATLNVPSGLCLSHPTLYIVDRYNNRIRQVDLTSSIITTLAGSGVASLVDNTGTSATFNLPVACAFNTSSTLVISDANNNAVRAIQISTRVVTTIANAPGPHGIWIDASYTIYVSRWSTGGIYRRRAWETGNFAIWVGSDTASGAVEGVGTNARLTEPFFITGDTSGYLYVGSEGGNRVYRIEVSTLTMTFFAGNGTAGNSGDGLTPLSATFNRPEGVVLDEEGNFYVGQRGLVR